jgi:hypothetical protein
MAEQGLDSDEATVWLSLADASSHLGVSVDALRSRARRGMITTRRMNDGRLQVRVPADLQLAGDKSADQAQLVSDRSGDQRLIDELREEIAELRERAIRAELDRDRMHEVTEAKMHGQERIIARLEADLALARQPWWRRWL